MGQIEIKENSFDMSPNPTTGLLQIKTRIQAKECELIIYNTLGEIIFSKPVVGNSLEMNLSVESGLYYACLKSKKGIQSKKVIVN